MKLPSLKTTLKSSKGFTLIEILIVIVIIGILAAIILAAIDPIEQINKANDVSKKSDAAELVNAIERYYATFQKWPADDMGTAPTGDDVQCITSLGSYAQTNGCLLDVLIDSGEVKAEFENKDTFEDNNVFVTLISNQVHACYVPVSKGFTTQAVQSQYCEGGATGTACICIPEQD